jgi:hypothetical protein
MTSPARKLHAVESIDLEDLLETTTGIPKRLSTFASLVLGFVILKT